VTTTLPAAPVTARRRIVPRGFAHGGLLLVLATAAFTIAARVFFHRWIDGVNETAMLATGEAAQLMILGLLAAFS